MKSNDYKQGFGDCRAKLSHMIEEALNLIHTARAKSLFDEYVPVPVDIKKEFTVREQELRRVRALLKGLKP